MSVNVYVHVSKLTCHFDLPQSPTLTELFQPSMIGSNNEHGCWVNFHHPPAILQITVSSNKLCLSLRLTAFRSYGMTPSFNTDVYFMPSKSIYISFKTNCHAFCAFWCYSVFLILVFCKFLESNMHFTLKRGLRWLLTVFTGPNLSWTETHTVPHFLLPSITLLLHCILALKCQGFEHPVGSVDQCFVWGTKCLLQGLWKSWISWTPVIKGLWKNCTK
jgi:hypothetical protein